MRSVRAQRSGDAWIVRLSIVDTRHSLRRGGCLRATSSVQYCASADPGEGHELSSILCRCRGPAKVENVVGRGWVQRARLRSLALISVTTQSDLVLSVLCAGCGLYQSQDWGRLIVDDVGEKTSTRLGIRFKDGNYMHGNTEQCTRQCKQQTATATRIATTNSNLHQ